MANTKSDPARDSGPVELGPHDFNTVSQPVVLAHGPRSKTPWLVAALAIVVAGAGGWAAWTAREDALAQGERATQAEGAQKILEASAVAAQKEAAALKAQAERLDRENRELIALKQQLSQDVVLRDEELARLKSTQDELLEKMKGEISSGDVTVTQVGGRLQVDLIDKILFESGDASISPRGEAVLAKVGAVLATVEDKLIQVAGHTDDSPPGGKVAETYPTNWELSAARATNVVRFLEDKAHVKGKRLVVSGFGQFAPVASNVNGTGRARNRRIEILLVPQQVAVKPPAPK